MTHTVQSSDIVIDDGVPGSSSGLRAVLSVPDGTGPFAAVVMVHEAFGIDEVMRRQVDRLASAGYIVVMPDLFTAGGARKCLTATFRSLAAGEGRAFDDIESARRAALAHPSCSGAVGVIGFCMGGGFALMTAARGFDASSVNYGRLPKDTDDALTGACPIVASYGARDRSLKGAAKKLEVILARLDVTHDVVEYPTAGHSFMNDAPVGPPLLRPLVERVIGARPDPASAADAWRRIESFFAEHLVARPAAR